MLGAVKQEKEQSVEGGSRRLCGVTRHLGRSLSLPVE